MVIEVAYGKVPLQARWERRLCKGRGCFGGVPSLSLQVFFGKWMLKHDFFERTTTTKNVKEQLGTDVQLYS